MCRLFGFRSIINSQVHSSLVHADNALSSQSIKHPDGWGVAYYLEQTPHLIKSVDRAVDDHIFHRVSGIVASQTVIAHIRKATHGVLNILNSHPFQYGKWVFAHNGNIKNFEKHKQKLYQHIDPKLAKFILGTTDSEVIFYLLLSLIKNKHPLDQTEVRLGLIKEATQELCQIVTKYYGPLYGGDDNDPKENHLTFILTTGSTMVAFNGGQSLNYSTHKKLCSERETCSYYSFACENKVKLNSPVNHLIFSSEELTGENIWSDLKKGEMVGVDSNMYFSKFELNANFS